MATAWYEILPPVRLRSLDPVLTRPPDGRRGVVTKATGHAVTIRWDDGASHTGFWWDFVLDISKTPGFGRGLQIWAKHQKAIVLGPAEGRRLMIWLNAEKLPIMPKDIDELAAVLADVVPPLNNPRIPEDPP